MDAATDPQAFEIWTKQFASLRRALKVVSLLMAYFGVSSVFYQLLFSTPRTEQVCIDMLGSDLLSPTSQFVFGASRWLGHFWVFVLPAVVIAAGGLAAATKWSQGSGFVYLNGGTFLFCLLVLEVIKFASSFPFYQIFSSPPGMP